MRETLIDILSNIPCGELKLIPTWMIEPLADALIENGVTVPTFKIGDIVWVYDPMWGIIPCEVDQPYHCRCGNKGECTFELPFMEKDIGRYVFDTKEDAEEVWGAKIAEQKKDSENSLQQWVISNFGAKAAAYLHEKRIL